MNEKLRKYWGWDISWPDSFKRLTFMVIRVGSGTVRSTLVRSKWVECRVRFGWINVFRSEPKLGEVVLGRVRAGGVR